MDIHENLTRYDHIDRSTAVDGPINKDIRPSTSRGHSRPHLSSTNVDSLKKVPNRDSLELQEMSSISEFVAEYNLKEANERIVDDHKINLVETENNQMMDIEKEEEKAEIDPAFLDMLERLQSRECVEKDIKIWSIKDATKNPHAINEWIKCMEDLQKRKHSSHINNSGFPSFEEMTQPVALELKNALLKASAQNVRVPDPNLNITVEQYARIVCCLLNIPVSKGSVIRSIHQMFRLYLELEAMKLESL